MHTHVHCPEHTSAPPRNTQEGESMQRERYCRAGSDKGSRGPDKPLNVRTQTGAVLPQYSDRARSHPLLPSPWDPHTALLPYRAVRQNWCDLNHLACVDGTESWVGKTFTRPPRSHEKCRNPLEAFIIVIWSVLCHSAAGDTDGNSWAV